MLKHNALVVVADGHWAMLFRNSARYGIELTEAGRITPESLNQPEPGGGSPCKKLQYRLRKEVSKNLSNSELRAIVNVFS